MRRLDESEVKELDRLTDPVIERTSELFDLCVKAAESMPSTTAKDRYGKLALIVHSITWELCEKVSTQFDEWAAAEKAE